MFGALFWLSSPAWDTVKITQSLKAGFICLFMVIDLRAEVCSSFITTTVRDKSQVTPQGRHR